MYDRASQEPDTKATFNGFLMFDEMSIQKDLQVQKKGGDWEIIGAVDMGSLVNGLEYLSRKSDEITLATHYFPFIYSSFGQFRFPVAYYASNNANGHSIYLTLWPLIDALSEYDFKVHAVLLDGSSNNRQMTRLMTSSLVNDKFTNFKVCYSGSVLSITFSGYSSGYQACLKKNS